MSGAASVAMRATDKATAAARLASSWLLAYPDQVLLARLDEIAAVVAELPDATREPLQAFIAPLHGTPVIDIQEHFVATFDMRRRACPYLTYWTAGDTRNRGMAILRFKQAYLGAGFGLGSEEMADHLAVLPGCAAIGDMLTGEALLAEYAAPIGLLHDALAGFGSPYAHVVAAVVATLPEPTPELQARMRELAAVGPPVEQVGTETVALAPFGGGPHDDLIGARR